MTFTVRSLLDLPEAQTVSLTPGVGEGRPITRAHVCERPDPWRWIGEGALVMTTGIPIPADPGAQRDYLTRLHEAGIAALAVDSEMPEHRFGEAALAHAAALGFPVLETAYEVPFVLIAEAVAAAVKRDERRGREEDLRRAERMYAALAAHRADEPVEALLRALEEILGGRLTLIGRRGAGSPGVVTRSAYGGVVVPLHAPAPAELHYSADAVDAPASEALLQHAGGIVGSALAVKAASRRSEWLHGSLLLAELCDDAVAASSAEHLVGAYGVHPAYLFAVCQLEDARTALEEVHSALAAHRVPALATLKDGQILILADACPPFEQRLAELAEGGARVGVSAPFTELAQIPNALSQARSALVRNHVSGRVLRFEEQEATSLFLPGDAEQLRRISEQVLGPLFTYDEQRGTSLAQTLRVFLEENRSWVRASERLFVHRQTLIARVSRIEKIIGRDLSSMEDTAACWLAVQAAIGCGTLEPGESIATEADASEG